MSEKRIKELAKKLNFRDVGLLAHAIDDVGKKTLFTDKQRARINEIKKMVSEK